jgi:DNA transposition AAA+ family ATPase
MDEKLTLYNTVAPLANVARLTQLIDRCQNRVSGLTGMGCFYGFAGYGKTTAGIFATNKFRAVHVEALPVGGTKALMEMIVTELGLRPAGQTTSLFAQAAQELGRTQRPLILDEADHLLTDRTIETIRALHDKTGVPIILMGEESLPQKLTRWERVHSRILSWVPAEHATIEDVGDLARIYARGVEIAPDLREAVLAASRGSLRHVSNNLAALAEHAALRGLKRLTSADWAGTFQSVEAPTPRRGLAPYAIKAGRGRKAVA